MLLISSRKLKHACFMMHASNDHSCLKEKSSWLSVTFFFMSEDCFILFHFIGVQEELFQRSTTATLQRPGATFEFTGMFIAKPPTKK